MDEQGAVHRKDQQGRNIWFEVLRCPRYVVAPMVDASELAWRLLSRRHGAQLCYTPMFHSSVFCKDAKYRQEALVTTQEDRPLIVQFCGNNPDTLAKAALMAEPYCDAIDLNIGCPQAIAKRGHYGAFLQEDWDLLHRIITKLVATVKVPITCKLRVFEDEQKTVQYAQMLEKAGASLLTVHGRTIEQKGALTGLASWDHIKAIRDAVSVPIFANGNIQCVQDVDRCLQVTGVQGVMTAEGNLYNPFIFEGRYPPCWEPALEYLEIIEKHPAPSSYIRGHLFKLFQKILCLSENEDVRVKLAENSDMDSFKSVANTIRDRYLLYHEGKMVWRREEEGYNLELPPWLCQPYVRSSPNLIKEETELKNDENVKRKYEDDDGNEISRKKMKKLRRMNRRPNKPIMPFKRGSRLCVNCPNPSGAKCEFRLCRQCCKDETVKRQLNCIGHKNFKNKASRLMFNNAEVAVDVTS